MQALELRGFFIYMKIGYVYKITSPSGKIYIGSSKDYLKRWESYRFKRYKFQIRLKNSFNKYGVKAHIFELIWEGDFKYMLQKEYEYGTLFNVLDRNNGLNLRLPKIDDQSICVSQESIVRMKNARKGKSANWNTKTISIYTLEGEFVKTFNSINECCEYLNCKPPQVSKVLKEKARRYKNYQIKYSDNTNNINSIREWKIKGSQIKRDIGKYSKEDILLEIFKSVREITDKYNYKHSGIYMCLNKKRKTTNGYKWKYIA